MGFFRNKDHALDMFATLLNANAKTTIRPNLKRKFGTAVKRKKYNVLYHDRQILVLNKDPWMKSQFNDEALEGVLIGMLGMIYISNALSLVEMKAEHGLTGPLYSLHRLDKV